MQPNQRSEGLNNMILKILGAREMVQWVGGHTAFAEDLS